MGRAYSRCVAWLRLRVGRQNLRWSGEVTFFVLALSAVLPLFAGRYVPIQDLPQHAAAVRVLLDYSAPELGFQRYFVTTPFATQYLSVYALAMVLASIFDAVVACKLVLALALVGTPYSLRLLLAALGKPQSFALLALPVAYNAHLVLGFINFLAGIPLMFWGLSLAVRLAQGPTRARAIRLAAVALVCFYTHVIPFGVLALGVGLLALADAAERGPRGVGLRLLPLAPSAAAALLWFVANPAGVLVSSLFAGGGAGESPSFTPPDRALTELSSWLLDVFAGGADDSVLVGVSVLLLSAFVSGARSAAPRRVASLRRVMSWLVPLTWLGYFVAPASYAFVWPINARFPLLALLLLITVVPRVSRLARAAIAVGAVALSVQATAAAWRAFRGAATEEYAGLAEVIAKVPQGSRVAGLIWARGSRFVHFSPYLHSVAWVQAERGGAVMFSFAEFEHSPFRFRDDSRPPRVPPRWEWQPQRVDPVSDLEWFEYVLTRGGPSRLPGFSRVARAGAFALWARR